MSLLLTLKIFFIIFSTLLGIIIGSFLNVVIYRVPAGRTISKGRSMCMSCGHTLTALDLVPMFSWLFLRGKCRYCKAPIASRYIKIESFTGLVFLINSLVFSICSYLPILTSNSEQFKFVLLLIFRYVMLLISFCVAIAVMMINFDTDKCFVIFPSIIFTLIIICSILNSISFKKVLLPLLGLIVSIFVFFILLIFKKISRTYDTNGFLFDLTSLFFIILTATATCIFSFSYVYVLAFYAIFYSLFRFVCFIFKLKLNKYIGIINVCSVVILLSLVYIIVL